MKEKRGGGLQPEELAADRADTINKIVASVLEGKYHREKIPSCDTLETYGEVPIFITVDLE